jgi:hypothetical protein
MTRIAITAEAFEAIKATLPLGSVGFETEPDAKGECYVWLEEGWVNKVSALRRPGESYSDIILRLVEMEARRGS